MESYLKYNFWLPFSPAGFQQLSMVRQLPLTGATTRFFPSELEHEKFEKKCGDCVLAIF